MCCNRRALLAVGVAALRQGINNNHQPSERAKEENKMDEKMNYSKPHPAAYAKIAGKPALKIYSEGQLFNVSVPLVECLAQYAPEGFVGDFLCPVIPVGEQAGAVPRFAPGDARLVNVDRTPGVEGNVVGFSAGSATAYCRSRSVRMMLPIEMEFATDPAWRLRESGALYLQGLLLLAKEVRVSSLVGDTSNVSTTCVPNSAWSGASNPLSHLETMISGVTSASGLRPDRIAFGSTAWQAFASNSSVQQRCGGWVTIPRVCEVLRVSSIAIGEARHNVAPGKERLFAPAFPADQVVVFRGGGPEGSFTPRWALSPNWKPSVFDTKERFIVELSPVSRRNLSSMLEVHHWETEAVVDPQLAAVLKGVNSAQAGGIA